MYSTLRDYQFSEGVEDDVRGSIVYGVNEEKLGKIDDLIFDQNSGSIKYAIIDSGGWLKSRRFLLPPEQVQQSSHHEGDFEASYTKQQIERFPALVEEIFTSEERFDEYERSYLDVYAPTSTGIPGRERGKLRWPCRIPPGTHPVTPGRPPNRAESFDSCGRGRALRLRKCAFG